MMEVVASNSYDSVDGLGKGNLSQVGCGGSHHLRAPPPSLIYGQAATSLTTAIDDRWLRLH